MGINERRQKEREIRRNDIIESAERIFSEKGYNSATMDDVAREAEFTKRTVYMYFNSKEQIYFEIMIKGYRLLIMLLDDTEKVDEAAGTDPVFRLKQMCAVFYKFSSDYPDYFKAIMEYENGENDFERGITDESRDECYALGEKVLGHLVDILKSGITEGKFCSDLDAEKTSLVLWSCMVGVFNIAKKKSNYLMKYHSITSEKLISEAFNIVMKSIEN